MELLQKLEAFKQKGAYGMVLTYGEGVGYDDHEESSKSRSFSILCSPVGYLGEAKAYYKGTVEDFLNFDLDTEPTLLSNPPKREDIEKPGFYYWGTDRSLEIKGERGKVFPY
jgi:hypothetical protein